MTEIVTYVEIDVPIFDDDGLAGFDGSTWLTRGAGLSGAADSKQFTFSMWVYRDSLSAAGARLFSASQVIGAAPSPVTNRIVASNPANQFSVNMNNSADVEIVSLGTGAVIPADRWTHYLGSFDLSDPTKCHLYQDDVSTLTVVTFTNDTIDFTRQEWSIGGYPDGSQRLTGGIGHFWFAPGVYMNLADPANRRKFISRDGRPARLGATGNAPTGVSPLIYMRGAFDAWQNHGTGGNFRDTNTFSPLEASTEPPPEMLQTFRFAKPTDYLDNKIDYIPSVVSESFQPSIISLGDSLGMRASLKLAFGDHKHSFKGESIDKGTFWGKWRGRYGTKLRGRNCRLVRGVAGQSLASMDVRHYIIDSTDGPTPDGVYSLEAKDVLKLADDDRSQAPLLSSGSLAGSIDASTTTATLAPAGIGDFEYPSSGWVCFAGKEVCAFTRNHDVLTLTRAQFGSVAATHSAGDRAQVTIRYTGNRAADIIYDLLVTYAGVPAGYINLSEWQAEDDANLGLLFARTICEPTSVRDLISEMIDNAALAVWWDDRAQTVKFQVLREISTDNDTFDETRLIAGSMQVKEQPDKRISQIWVYFGQRDPTDGGAKEDGYRLAVLDTDLDRETEYGSAAIVKVEAKWIETETAAERLATIKLSRFRDPPRNFQFSLRFDEIIALAQGYGLEWWANQDEDGNAITAPIQITKLARFDDHIEIEAEEMLASGTFVLTHAVILTSAGALHNWQVPATWNNLNNSVEGIGGGSGGFYGTNGNQPSGAGGAGGGWSRKNNITLTPGALVPYFVGLGGTRGFTGSNTPPTAGQDTFFGASTFAGSTMGAKGATAPASRTIPGVGGQAAAGIGDEKFSGGDGGTGAPRSESVQDAGGGGGGGAAGPHGDGADGGSGTSTAQNKGCGGGAADGGQTGHAADPIGDSGGGDNRFNFGGGDASQPTGQQGAGGAGGDEAADPNSSGQGGDGEQLYTQTEAPIFSAGPGGGGGGGGTDSPGAQGGLYGGGGGGSGNASNGGDGRQGLIFIQWQEAS